MQRIKVLHLVEDLKIGGLERVIESIVTGLDNDRYNTEVWCLAHGGEIANDLIEKEVIVKILKMKSYYNPLRIIALSRLMRKEKIEILHTHGYFGSTFGRLAAIPARVPVIITHVHSTYYGYNKRNILIERLLSFFTDKIVCVSEAVRTFVEDVENIDPNKICLIYNGVAPTPIPGKGDGVTRDSFGLSDSDIVVITVASLVPHKGHRILIDAMNIISLKYENLRLLIVGDGPLRNYLCAYAKELQLFHRIVFAGKRNNIYSLLRLADIFILPSIEREGLGIALIEAMAMGLPLIGTRLGGIPEIIEEDANGILCTPGNSKELAAAMEQLISDTLKRKKMGYMGKRIYEEKFNVEKMVQRIEILYNQLIQYHSG